MSKQADERREAGPMECWCLHGAVGMAADFRSFAKRLAAGKTGSRAVDLWRFLECQPLPLTEFGAALNADASGEVSRGGGGRALLGYSMGGRLALHALLAENPPWQAAVIVSAHPGLESSAACEIRRTADAAWAGKALTGNWQEFLTSWNAQSLLGGEMRAAQASGSLVMRRREIARSFVDWSLGTQQPLWERLTEIQIPILWVVGEKDPKFLDLARRAVDKLPNATLAIAPNSGHRVPWDAEEWLAEKVSHFLRLG